MNDAVRVEKIVFDCSDVGLLGDEDFVEFIHYKLLSFVKFWYFLLSA